MNEMNDLKQSCKYRDLYRKGAAFLTDSLPGDYEDAKLDARLLLEEVCGTDLQTLLVYPDRPVTPDECASYEAFLKRRAAHEPTAMILGQWGFMGLSFYVDHNVLIPEQDTEILVETALEKMQKTGKKQVKVLDMCTGSGCILLSILHYMKEKQIDAVGIGCDLSENALQVAKRNQAALDPEAGTVLLQGDLFDALDPYEEKTGQKMLFDLFVSNPPYIATDVIETLPEEVKSGEPYMALDGGADGLVFYRRIAEGIRSHMTEDGIIIVEIGFDQGISVPQIFRESGFDQIEVLKDYGGNDRVVAVRIS